MDTKHCGGCTRDLPISCFSKNPSRKDGLNTRCKDCHAEYQAAWYIRNREKHLKAALSRRKETAKDSRKRIYLYLLKNPCVDCGESDPIVLEFDHVRGNKTKNVSSLVNSGYSWEDIFLEIEKCEVRCANCHRRATSKRQNWFSLSFESGLVA